MSAELPNGDVLLAGGGSTACQQSPEGELLAANGSGFTPAGYDESGADLYAAGDAPASSGDVLVAGGDTRSSQSDAAVPATAEVWSPAGGGTFTATAR